MAQQSRTPRPASQRRGLIRIMLYRSHRRIAKAHHRVPTTHEIIDGGEIRLDPHIARVIVAGILRMLVLNLAATLVARFARVDTDQRGLGIDSVLARLLRGLRRRGGMQAHCDRLTEQPPFDIGRPHEEDIRPFVARLRQRHDDLKTQVSVILRIRQRHAHPLRAEPYGRGREPHLVKALSTRAPRSRVFTRSRWTP